MSEYTTPRKSVKLGNDARGNASGTPTKQATNRTKAAPVKKATYVRKDVRGYDVQETPKTRSAEGSLLTPGSIEGGKNQPFSREKPQRMSKLKKGAD